MRTIIVITLFLFTHPQLFSQPARIYASLDEALEAPGEVRHLKPGIAIKKNLSALSRFENLEILDLSYNELTEIPAEVFTLGSLKQLMLRGNSISSIPGDIGKLKKLEKLDLSNNLLKAFPASFAELAQLKVLNIGQNEFDEVPYMICELVNLENLNVSLCGAIGALPHCLKNLEKLSYFNYDRMQSLPFPASFFANRDIRINGRYSNSPSTKAINTKLKAIRKESVSVH